MSAPYKLLSGQTGGGSPVVTSAGQFGGHGLSGGGVGIGNATVANQPDAFLQTGTIANDSTGGTMGSGTMECWVKRATTPAGLEIFLGHDRFFWLGCSTDGKPTLHYGGGGVSELVVSTTTNICNNAWHHVAVDWNAGKPTIYVDGASVGSNASTQAVGTSSFGFQVGMYSNVSTFNWGGVIDEVSLCLTRKYTSAFTAPTAVFPVVRAGQVALYRFDQDFVDYARTIGPDDANIVYSPFNWDISVDRALSINPGAYFRALISGSPTSLVACFDVAGVLTPLPQLYTRIDGGPWTAQALAETVTLAMPASNTWTSHTVEVLIKSTTETQNRWSAVAASVRFNGIVAVGGSSWVTVALTKRPLNILAYGDSIVEGVRTLNSGATNDTDRNDALLGWAYQLRDTLGAEVGVVGFGGTGISASGSGSVPALPSSYALLYSGSAARSFSAPAPNLIVINEGTNDGATNIQAAYTSLLNSLLAATPSTTMILAMRPFNGNAASYVAAAAAACNAPLRVVYVDTTSWFNTADSSDATHPYGYTNVERIAPLLAAAYRAALPRGSSYAWAA